MIRHQRDSERYSSLPAPLRYLHSLYYFLARSASRPTENDNTNISPAPPQKLHTHSIQRGISLYGHFFFFGIHITGGGGEKHWEAYVRVRVHLAERVQIQFPHLYFGSRQEQGDISAVLPGENSYRLLSVLDVHSIYLAEKKREARTKLSDNPKRPCTSRPRFR